MNYNNDKGNKSVLIIGIVLIILVFGAIFVVGQNNNNQTGQNIKQSQFQVSEKLYDFGTISMAKGKVNHIFKVTNPTDKDIDLKTVTTSCMCTAAYIEKSGSEKGPFGMPGMGYVPPANEIIKPGESRDIKVVYDPAAHGPAGVGAIDRFVYLSDANGGKIQLEIKANVTP